MSQFEYLRENWHAAFLALAIIVGLLVRFLLKRRKTDDKKDLLATLHKLYSELGSHSKSNGVECLKDHFLPLISFAIRHEILRREKGYSTKYLEDEYYLLYNQKIDIRVLAIRKILHLYPDCSAKVHKWFAELLTSSGAQAPEVKDDEWTSVKKAVLEFGVLGPLIKLMSRVLELPVFLQICVYQICYQLNDKNLTIFVLRRVKKRIDPLNVRDLALYVKTLVSFTLL